MREMLFPWPLGAAQGQSRFPRHPDLTLSCAGTRWKGGDPLAVTISSWVLLAVAVFILCRFAGVRVLHAAVCILFGFFLASSSFAPDISRFVSSLIRLL